MKEKTGLAPKHLKLDFRMIKLKDRKIDSGAIVQKREG